MSSKDHWLKLHTSILTSAKFVTLPSNDHRCAFYSLMILQKKGLIHAPEEYIAAHVFLSVTRWREVRADLVDSRLIHENGEVVGFDESQTTPEAYRKQQQRERDMSRDKSRETSRQMSRQNAESRKQRAESRIQTADSERVSELKTENRGEAEATVASFIAARKSVDPGWTPSIPLDLWEMDLVRLQTRTGRSWDQISDAIDYFAQDDFWRGTISTVPDFCRHFDRIVTKMAAEKAPAAQAGAKLDRYQIAELRSQVAEGTAMEWIDAQKPDVRPLLLAMLEKIGVEP